MSTKLGGKAKLEATKGKQKICLVYKLEPNIKRSLMPNFEAPTSPPSFSNGHPTTLGWLPMLTSVRIKLGQACVYIIQCDKNSTLKDQFQTKI